ncbi:uncharacterized protein LOC115623915 [Scaptodrosophila lebanonensis]|uniref:Uncharacterized protein LOC115623915 n=1 Tax=Drosophila lebanonensis TaxID=7225 RepID=A0A6J2TC12_DROLE|nr:uncharacterized protein LOC115623915 [Scaptodrosophila lebanonensis]
MTAEIPRCHNGDTDCIINVSHTLIRQHARTGYPSAGFPQVEPFLVKRFDISDGRTGSLNLKLAFRDVNVEGLSGVKFDRAVGFGANPATTKFEMYGSFPKIVLRGKYNADGRILILPIRGDGDADITLHSPKFSVKFKPGVQQHDGRTYLTVDKLKVLVEPQLMNIKLTNLFNGDQALGTNLNQFLNENWSDVWGELQPSIHVAIAEIMKSILSTLFKRFAYEDLFLELLVIQRSALYKNKAAAREIVSFANACIRIGLEMFRVVGLLVLCLIVAGQAKFPDDPKPCKHADKKCLLNIVNHLLSEKAVVGDSSINLVKLDPLRVAKMNIKQGADSPVNIDLTFTDNEVFGIKTLKLLDIRGFGTDLAKKHELRMKSDAVSLVGPYNIKGKVLILPISGSGISNLTLVNCNVVIVFTGKAYEKNGETYMKATNLKVEADPERLIYNFTNLFNGDKALGDNMNAFLNENWKSIFLEVQQSMQNAFAKIFEAIISNVFTKYPYAKFFEA